MNRPSGLLGILLVCQVVTGSSRAEGGGPEVQKVFAAWKARQTKVKAARYRLAGEAVVRVSNRNVRCPKKVVVLLDFVKQRCRLEKEETYYDEAANGLKSRVSTSAFDDKEHRSVLAWNANERPEGAYDMVVTTGNLRQQGFISEDWPPFIAHGYIPTLSYHILPGRFQPPYDPSDFYFHGNAVHAKRPCVVVRTEAEKHRGVTFDEWWVDMERGGAVLRQVAYVDGQPAIDLDIQYQQMSAGWLPSSWTVTRRGRGRTIRSEKMRVEGLDLLETVAAGEFYLEAKPGMKVYKIHNGGSPDSIAVPLPVSEETFIADARGDSGATKPGGISLWNWAILVIALAAALMLGIWWRRRRGRVKAA